MKKLITALLLCSGLAYADDGIYKSSTTLSNDTALIQTTTATVSRVLEAVLVTSGSLNGVCTVFSSSFVGTNMSTISIVNMTNAQYWDFKGIKMKGIVYKTTNNVNGITIIYKD